MSGKPCGEEGEHTHRQLGCCLGRTSHRPSREARVFSMGQQVVRSTASIPRMPRITVGSPVEPQQYAGQSSSQNQTGSAFVGRPDVWSTPSQQHPRESSLCLAAMRCAADLVLDGSSVSGPRFPEEHLDPAGRTQPLHPSHHVKWADVSPGPANYTWSQVSYRLAGSDPLKRPCALCGV